MNKIKSKYKRIAVNLDIGNKFQAYCKSKHLDLTEASEIIFNFLVENDIHPDDLNFLLKKNISEHINQSKIESQRRHDWTVGFLRTFEQKQQERDKLLGNMIEKIQRINKDNRAYYLELLYNSQVYLTLTEQEIGTKITNDNWDRIIKATKD